MTRALLVLALIGCGGATPSTPPVVADRDDCTQDGSCSTCRCRDGERSPCTVTVCDVEPVDRVRFAAGSDQVPQGAHAMLDAVAQMLGEHPDLAIIVVGHASAAEPDAMPLSLARAQAVQAALIARGAAPAQVDAEGRGATEPLGGAADDDRRVDFVPRTG